MERVFTGLMEVTVGCTVAAITLPKFEHPVSNVPSAGLKQNSMQGTPGNTANSQPQGIARQTLCSGR